MTVLVDSMRFSRSSDLLWRDTGRHVLVLPPDVDGQVLVLGGGGAAVWRLLEEPRTLQELTEHFTNASKSGQPVPDLAAVATCVDELAACGVLHVAGSRT